MKTHRGRRHEVNLAPELDRELSLSADKVKQRHPVAELDQRVDVALGAILTARHRPEHGGPTNPEPGADGREAG